MLMIVEGFYIRFLGVDSLLVMRLRCEPGSGGSFRARKLAILIFSFLLSFTDSFFFFFSEPSGLRRAFRGDMRPGDLKVSEAFDKSSSLLSSLILISMLLLF